MVNNGGSKQLIVVNNGQIVVNDWIFSIMVNRGQSSQLMVDREWLIVVKDNNG